VARHQCIVIDPLAGIGPMRDTSREGLHAELRGRGMRTLTFAATSFVITVCCTSFACTRPGDAATADTPAQAEASTAVEFLTSALTEGLGLPFSESARVGDLILLSGMIGVRPGTLELVPGGIDAESRQALANIEMMLGAAGATRTDVVKCTIMLDDMSHWSRFNEIHGEFFGTHRPARTAFGTDGLALGAVVEIECIARAPGNPARSLP
jgi:reactive intermediate/imine deaminase